MTAQTSVTSDLQQTPYNNKNKLITDDEIRYILKTYGISEEPRDYNIYRKAFVHKSYCTRKNENFVDGNVNCPEDCLPLQEESNERLEFLGDSILNMVVAGYLFERYSEENEGWLTRLRTKLVNGKMLAHLSKLLEFNKYIILSKQIEENEGRFNSNILEDAFEAFIAAIYQDFGEVSGFKHAQSWIIDVLETNIDFSDLIKQNHNYKDLFLKYFQHNYSYIPKFYEVKVDTTANNQKIYTICIKDNNNNILSIGKGASKKEAENSAAKAALERYTDEYK
jgi:ribonuclease-3